MSAPKIIQNALPIDISANDCSDPSIEKQCKSHHFTSRHSSLQNTSISDLLIVCADCLLVNTSVIEINEYVIQNTPEKRKVIQTEDVCKSPYMGGFIQ